MGQIPEPFLGSSGGAATRRILGIGFGGMYLTVMSNGMRMKSVSTGGSLLLVCTGYFFVYLIAEAFTTEGKDFRFIYSTDNCYNF